MTGKVPRPLILLRAGMLLSLTRRHDFFIDTALSGYERSQGRDALTALQTTVSRLRLVSN